MTGPERAPATRKGSEGAAGRVAAVHAQTRRGLVVAAGFVLAAVLAAVGSALSGDDWWLPLHLFVVGGLLSAISATTQMFAVTWSAAPAPHPIVAGAQRWALAGGTVALVVGREADRTWIFVGGAVTVAMALLALAVILLQVRRQAVTDRYAPAIEAYVAAIAAGTAGVVIGAVLGSGEAGGRYVELRGAHLVLNVFGLVGLVVAGSLPYFVATQVRSKMSRRADPVALRSTVAVLAVATAGAATGQVLGRPGVVAVGLAGYALGLLVIAVLLPAATRARLRWGGPRVVQLLAGLAWWVAMTAAFAGATVRDADDRAILHALVTGGYAQILVASLAYLGPVLRGGGHQRLTAGFAITRSWVSVVAGNAAALAALVGSGAALAGALVVWTADFAFRAGRLLWTVSEVEPD